MDFRKLAWAGGHLLWVAAAQAQTAAPVVVPVTAPVADKAAMERAQREADGPKRRILEAARLKVSSRTSDNPALLPAATPPVTARARPDGVESEAVVATLPAAAVPLPVAPPPTATVPGVSPVAVVELRPAAVRLLSMPAPRPAVQDLPPPVLLSKVDPEWPGRLFRRGAQRTEVVVELTLRTDGTVGEATVRHSTNPELETPALEAVRQWRYEPQPAPRQHVVRLVASPG